MSAPRAELIGAYLDAQFLSGFQHTGLFPGRFSGLAAFVARMPAAFAAPTRKEELMGAGTQSKPLTRRAGHRNAIVTIVQMTSGLDSSGSLTTSLEWQKAISRNGSRTKLLCQIMPRGEMLRGVVAMLMRTLWGSPRRAATGTRHVRSGKAPAGAQSSLHCRPEGFRERVSEGAVRRQETTSRLCSRPGSRI